MRALPFFLLWALLADAAPMSERTLEDGDAGWIGLNETDPPALLQPGEYSAGENVRSTTGEIAPRLGVSKLRWAARILSGVPVPYGQLFGAGEFRDANGRRWTILAGAGRVWKCHEGYAATEVPMPPGEWITYEVSFAQTQNGLMMFRGTERRPLYMKTLEEGFKPIAQEDNVVAGAHTENSKIDPASGSRIAEDGTAEIPSAESGEWSGNRMFIPHETAAQGKDLVGISLYLNATRYAPILSQARINQGSADRLVRLKKFDQSRMACFKEKSIYALYNIEGNLSGMFQDEITREYGLCAKKSVVQVGRDEGDNVPPMLWFLAEKRGVMALVVGAEGKLEVTAVPVSRDIEKLIGRIDWRNAHKAVGDFWGNKFYLAVPLDDSKCYGPELVRGISYDGGSRIFPVIPGMTYRWVKGANDAVLDNGAEQLSDSSEFTAAGSTIVLSPTEPSVAVTASIKRVYTDVNNAILVYDFLRKKWAGVDQGSAIMVRDFVRTELLGAERLAYTSEDGWLNAIEELAFDEVVYESLSNELVVALAFDATGQIIYNVIPSRQYTLKLAAGESLENGAAGTIAGPYDATFVAVGSLVTVRGTPLDPVTHRMRLVSWTFDTEWITTDATLRGYTCEKKNRRKRFFDGEVGLRGWYPQFAISAITDGVSEEVPVQPRVSGSSITKDPTKYVRPFNKAAWDATNKNNDHATRDREDYSVVLGETTTPSGSIAAGVIYFVESTDVTSACSIVYNAVTYNNQTTFTGVAGVTTYTVASGSPKVYGPGNYVYLKDSGIDFDKEQEWTENLRLPATVRGRWCQFRIVNTRGRLTITGASVRAEIIDRSKGAKH